MQEVRARLESLERGQLRLRMASHSRNASMLWSFALQTLSPAALKWDSMGAINPSAMCRWFFTRTTVRH